MTYWVSIPNSQFLLFYILPPWISKLFQISHYLSHCICHVSFVILKIDIRTQLPLFVFVQTHQPVHHVIKIINSLNRFLTIIRCMSKVNPWYFLLLPTLAELVFVIKKAQLFYYIIHYQVSINYWFVTYNLFVCLAQLTHLRYVKSLIRVQFKHCIYHLSKFSTVFLMNGWVLPLCNPLK